MPIRITSKYTFINNNNQQFSFEKGAVVDDPELESFIRRDTQSWVDLESEEAEVEGSEEQGKDSEDPDEESETGGNDSESDDEVDDESEEEEESDEIDLDSLSFRELQAQAKEAGVSAGGSREDLIKRILESQPDEEDPDDDA